MPSLVEQQLKNYVHQNEQQADLATEWERHLMTAIGGICLGEICTKL